MDENCVICMDCKPNMITLDCGHKFHCSCLEKWICQDNDFDPYENFKSCPCCRAPINLPSDTKLSRQVLEMQLYGVCVTSKESNDWWDYKIILEDIGDAYEVTIQSTSFVLYLYDYHLEDMDYTYMKWKTKRNYSNYVPQII